MRFVRFFRDDEAHVGLAQDESVFDLTAASQNLAVDHITSVRQLMTDPDLVKQLTKVGIRYRRDDVRLDAPIRDVPKLLALAGNFRKHVVESGFRSVESQDVITPQVFLKPPSNTINGPGGAIALRC